MKGPNNEILINIDFWNLSLWTFLKRGDGDLRETFMGCFSGYKIHL